MTTPFLAATPRHQLATTIDMLDQLGELVLDERERRYVCQEGAARQIGISVETLAMIEHGTGKQGPSLRTIRMVIAWLIDTPSHARIVPPQAAA